VKRRIAAIAALCAIVSSQLTPGVASAALIGDVNGDCKVDVIDLYIVGARFGATRGSLLYSPYYDLNGNGRIDAGDIQTVAVHAGETC